MTWCNRNISLSYKTSVTFNSKSHPSYKLQRWIKIHVRRRKLQLTNGWNSGDDLSKFELVQDSRLTSSIETNHQNTHLFLRKELAEQLTEWQTHFFKPVHKNTLKLTITRNWIIIDLAAEVTRPLCTYDYKIVSNLIHILKSKSNQDLRSIIPQNHQVLDLITLEQPDLEKNQPISLWIPTTQIQIQHYKLVNHKKTNPLIIENRRNATDLKTTSQWTKHGSRDREKGIRTEESVIRER